MFLPFNFSIFEDDLCLELHDFCLHVFDDIFKFLGFLNILTSIPINMKLLKDSKLINPFKRHFFLLSNLVLDDFSYPVCTK